MRKNILLILASLALLASCAEKTESTPEEPEAPPVELGIELPAEVTVVLPDEGPLSLLSWKEADKVRIGGAEYTLTGGAETRAGTFAGECPKDRFFTISYPSGIAGVEEYLSESFAGQAQTGNGSTAHLQPTVLLEDVVPEEDGRFELSAEWASAHDGSLRSNGIISLSLALPADAGAIESITLECPGVKFPVDNAGLTRADKLTLTLNDISAGSNTLLAFLAVPEKALTIDAEPGLTITLEGEKTYFQTIKSRFEMGGGILTEIKVTDPSSWTFNSIITGEGTEASPYILMNAQDVNRMGELLVKGSTIWFELGDDIDMASITDWTPLNTANPYDKAIHFDGKNHTISNFSCADKIYTSFFGALNGTVKDVTFDKATCKQTTTSGGYTMAIVAAFCGITGLNDGVMENVHVTNGYVTSSANPSTVFPLGGLAGTAVRATIKDSSFDGSIVNNIYGTGDYPDRSATGGIAGRVNDDSSIEGCTVRGEISSSKGRYIAGIAGWVAPSSDIPIKDCTNYATISGGADRAAGIIGHYQQGTVEGCVNKGKISAQKTGSESGTGGIVGYTGIVAIKSCSNEGEISGTGQYVGGIIGCGEKLTTVERCFSTGNVTAVGRHVGGIAGGFKAEGCIICDCWSSGTVKSTGDQDTGGIVGTLAKNQTVSRCYSTAEVISQRTAGGIVGHACNLGWSYSTACGDVVEKCIAWNPVVRATADGEGFGSSGAIVGFTSFANTLTACWRRPDMDFKGCDTAHNTLCDQPDCSPSSPFTMGTTPGTYGTVCAPYHGKAAAANSSVSSIAQSLGWSTEIWNFTNDYPSLL